MAYIEGRAHVTDANGEVKSVLGTRQFVEVGRRNNNRLEISGLTMEEEGTRFTLGQLLDNNFAARNNIGTLEANHNVVLEGTESILFITTQGRKGIIWDRPNFMDGATEMGEIELSTSALINVQIGANFSLGVYDPTSVAMAHAETQFFTGDKPSIFSIGQVKKITLLSANSLNPTVRSELHEHTDPRFDHILDDGAGIEARGLSYYANYMASVNGERIRRGSDFKYDSIFSRDIIASSFGLIALQQRYMQWGKYTTIEHDNRYTRNVTVEASNDAITLASTTVTDTETVIVTYVRDISNNPISLEVKRITANMQTFRMFIEYSDVDYTIHETRITIDDLDKGMHRRYSGIFDEKGNVKSTTANENKFRIQTPAFKKM
jgi:hypothetical protein